MSIVNGSLQVAGGNNAWHTTYAAEIPLARQIVLNTQTGQYKIGDGSTALSGLTYYGGAGAAWGSITGTLSNQTDLQNALNAKQNTITTGTTAQYFRGDLSLATFPTAVSSFTNDSGYITSAALSPYLTSATAALTYQPIGSYLTSSAIGVTVQGYSANTTLLGNSTTGSGSIVLATSPTFGTSIQVGSGTNSGRASEIFQDTASVKIGSRVGTTADGAIYFSAATPSDFVSCVSGLGTGALRVAGGNGINIVVGGANAIAINSFLEQTFTNFARTSGAFTAFTFTPAASTGQTASTNIPNFRVNGSTKTWAAGTITNQYWNYFTANTAAFASASTITNSYGLFVEAATAGTNATITNNYAFGTNGKAKFGGNIELTQTVTTESLTSDTSVTIVINGTTYKLLAKA